MRQAAANAAYAGAHRAAANSAEPAARGAFGNADGGQGKAPPRERGSAPPPPTAGNEHLGILRSSLAGRSGSERPVTGHAGGGCRLPGVLVDGPVIQAGTEAGDPLPGAPSRTSASRSAR